MRDTAQITFPVSGMTCAACQSFVQRTLEEQPGVKNASVNLMLNQATVTFEPGVASPQTIVEAVRETGYGADLPQSGRSVLDEQAEQDAAVAHEYLRLRTKATVSLAAGTIAMCAMPYMHGRPFFNAAMLLLTLFVMLWAGARFYSKAWSALRHKTADMNTLIALGTGAAFLFSLLSHENYYETVIFIIALVLTGNTLEARAKRQTTAALRGLLELQPKTVRVIAGEEEIDLPVEQLRPGLQILVRPGERVGADGVVVSGSSSIDESMVTGESMPVDKTAGSRVIGGTLNKVGAIRVQVTGTPESGMLAQIVRQLRDAQGSRAPIQRLADRVSAVFVPVVVLLAIATFLAWYILNPALGLDDALTCAIAVLVIACPCAMGLAVPAAVMVATGRAARDGILIAGGEALQRLEKVDTIVLDKTGTITAGKPSVTGVSDWSGQPVLRFAAALEKLSEHPLAEAVVRYAREQGLEASEVRGFEAIPGMGVKGTVDGHLVAVGNTALIPDAASRPVNGGTPLFVAVDGRLAGMVEVSDTVKPESIEAIRGMRQAGLKVVMASGDNERSARAVAAASGIDDVYAGILPTGKLELIKKMQQDGRVVAMAGDGINDAPALAQADIGIAMGSGADVAIHASDVTLLRGDLRGVLQAIRLSRQTMRVMKQNLFWALVYNLIGIPLAAFGWLNPIFASAAMAFSSVSVVSNSLRLRRGR